MKKTNGQDSLNENIFRTAIEKMKSIFNFATQSTFIVQSYSWPEAQELKFGEICPKHKAG